MAGASLSRRSARSASWLFVVGWLIIAALLPQKIIAAAVPTTIRVGYPQPSGAMLLLWVISEARLDQKYGFNLQNIYISGGARLTQTVVSADIDMAATGGAVINAVLSGAELVYIAAGVPTYGFSLYSRADVKDVPSLKGKVVGLMTKGASTDHGMIFSGVLERYSKLKVVSVENEIGWMPFWLEKCDKAYKRHRHSEKVPMTKLPSEYFAEQIYATFFNDRVGGQLFSWWGVDNCMWSNDYPHQNSTWPNSRAVIERDMAHLSAADRDKLLNTNVRKLYKLNTPASLPKAA